MQPVKSLPPFTEAILWGEDCGYFIGRMAPVPTQDNPHPEGVEYLFWEDDDFRDDYPEVEQWQPLPDPSIICARCGNATERYDSVPTPDGWRFICIPNCQIEGGAVEDTQETLEL